MKKKLILGLVGASLMSGAFARELRTPWALWHGPEHARIPWPVADDTCWNFNVWFGAENKQSNKAFPNKNTFKSEGSLAGIIFGKDSFVLLDAFAPGVTSPTNPFLGTALIRPKYCYNENSAWFGLTTERTVGCDCRWRVGGRAILPFRAIKTTLENCCDIDIQETVNDMCRTQRERIDGTDIGTPIAEVQGETGCYAYRLDLLSSLFLQQAGVPPFEPFVVYENPLQNDDITFVNNEIVVSDANNNPIHVIQRDNGTAPTGAFCATQSVVNASPFVAGDGSGLTNNERGRFSQAIDYSALAADPAAQRQLWVVPTVQNSAGQPTVNDDAQTIGTMIQTLLRTANQTAISFLQENGIDLGTQKLNGLGMLNTELYANREFCSGFMEGFVGVQWPTGIRVKNPGQVLKIFTTGNNHHYELRVGGVAQWHPTCWFALKIDGLYAYAFKATERVAASFKGATVKNIGPAIDAKISWDYLFGHVNFNFFNPCNTRTGFMFGYEWYVKFKDKVRFNQTTATDLLGNVRELDPNVLEFRTNVISHKGQVEFFHQGDFWEVFAGWTSVFAGKNAPKESDWYIGFIRYF